MVSALASCCLIGHSPSARCWVCVRQPTQYGKGWLLKARWTVHYQQWSARPSQLSSVRQRELCAPDKHDIRPGNVMTAVCRKEEVAAPASLDDLVQARLIDGQVLRGIRFFRSTGIRRRCARKIPIGAQLTSEFQAAMRAALMSTTTTSMSGHLWAIMAIVGPAMYEVLVYSRTTVAQIGM